MQCNEHIFYCLPHLIGEHSIVISNALGNIFVHEHIMYYMLYNDYALYISPYFLRLWVSLFNYSLTEELIQDVFRKFLNCDHILYSNDSNEYSRMKEYVKNIQNKLI